MASRRILTFLPRHIIFLYFLGIVVIGSSLTVSCGTTGKVKNKPGNTSESTGSKKEATNKISDEMLAVLAANRSNLRDVYATQKSDKPKVFFEKSGARDIGNPNQGYRVQILSTRNIERADSVADDFRFWADSAVTDGVLKGYIPKAYVLFKQPYYKVHIGNFQFQDQALKLNRLLKSRYPGAWVVHDEIEPNLVPPDTLSFNKDKDELQL